MKRVLKYLVAALFLGAYISCEKKVDMKIKDQARDYPVIFGILTNDEDERTVTVSSTESFSGKKADEDVEAGIKVQNFPVEEVFTRTGKNTYKMNGELLPYSFYSFVCTYRSVEYSYSVVTNDLVEIDSVSCIPQAGGKYLVNASFITTNTFADILIQVQLGTIGPGNDTTWKRYNERFPLANPKIDFLRPLSMMFDSTGRYSQDIIPNAAFAKNDLVKIEIYAIDPMSSMYLSSLSGSGSNLLDPLSLSPYTMMNSYAFDKEALGIIIPAMKSKKIFRVP